jgi:DNA invertase Pin-like site-specific DNA recombinase
VQQLEIFDELLYNRLNNTGRKGEKPMRIGYIRVSKDEQATLLQEDALKRELCERIFLEKVTGRRFDRTEFLKMLEILRPGDIVIVWKLDRLGRSLKELIETVQTLEKRGVELKSLKENIDTSTATGRLMFHIFASLAEFEADITRERTHAGLEAARARGRRGGRPKAIDTIKPAQLARARALYEARQNSIAEIMALTGFKSRATFYKYVVNTGGNREV